jgi:hypothetical protein
LACGSDQRRLALAVFLEIDIRVRFEKRFGRWRLPPCLSSSIEQHVRDAVQWMGQASSQRASWFERGGSFGQGLPECRTIAGVDSGFHIPIDIISPAELRGC